MYYGTSPIVTSGSVLNIDPSNWAQQTSRNLYNYTTDLTNTFWTKTRCQITASAGTAPDATNTAFAMTITDATGLVRITTQPFTASVAGGPYTFSIYVKKNNCTAGAFQLGIYDGNQAVAGIEPDYAIQANFIQTGSIGPNNPTRRTEDAGNGWYRVATTVTLTSSVYTFQNFIDIENGYGGSKVNGESILLWGPQFEVGSVATPYQPVNVATRIAPDLSGNNNIGTFNSGRPTWTPNNGGSIAFLAPYSNNPAINFSSSPTINISGSSMSGEIWVKFTKLDYTTSSGSLMTFFRKGQPDNANPNNGFWFSYDNRANRSSFSYTCFGNTAGGFAGGGNNFGDVQYYQNFVTGSWNHIVFTINNSTGSFYINGVQKGQNKNFTNLNLYDTGSSIMGETYFDVIPSSPAPFEVGVFRLYNRALSQNEISQNYNSLKTRFRLT
jgi:hypothetical protein